MYDIRDPGQVSYFEASYLHDFLMDFQKLFFKVRLFFLKKRMGAVSMAGYGCVPRFTSRSAETLDLSQLLTSLFVSLQMASGGLASKSPRTLRTSQRCGERRARG